MIALVCLFVAAQAATASIDEEKNRPVTKVINLLKDMQSQLAKEAEEDEEVYQKVKCWCTTGDKDKTTAISDAEARITDLTSTIEEETASSSRLTTEIKNLEKEVAKNTDALDKATNLRTKELAEFNAEEKDLLQSINALKGATTVLSKHQSFLQVPSDTLINMSVMIQGQFKKHSDLIDQIATPSQRKAVNAFIESPSDYFDGKQDSLVQEGYAPQSGAIFGILSQMKETFETNLANSQKEEKDGQASFANLKKAKEEEIAAGQQQRDTKTQELADSGANLAEAKQDLSDTRNSLAADQEFLSNLKQTCQTTDQEMEERTKTRQEEIQACGEALAILSSDDAHDTFTKTFNFLQVSVQTDSRRDQAAKILKNAAKKFNNPRLATLAMSTKLDAFKKLNEDIDGMIDDLKKEKADDVKQKDYCVENMNQNERAMEQKTRDIEKSDATISSLKEQIAQLTQSIEDLTAEVAEMQKQLKRAGEDRELENKDFQNVISDQRATQELLTNALNVLQGFYDKKALIQVHEKKQPAPAGFKTYKKSGGSGGVMGMLEGIIAEAKQMEADSIQAEADSQKAYESFVKDTNKSMDEKNRDITNKKAAKAQAEEDLVAADENRDAQLADQQRNQNENADLHNSCDFTLDNFTTRQAALEQEMESLRQAQSVLAGSGGAFLQKRA